MNLLAFHLQKLQEVNFADINGRWRRAREDAAFVQEEEKLCEPSTPAALRLPARLSFSKCLWVLLREIKDKVL